MVAEVRPEDEHEAAADTEKGVEHRELDDGADTHVLVLTLAEDGQHLQLLFITLENRDGNEQLQRFHNHGEGPLPTKAY